MKLRRFWKRLRKAITRRATRSRSYTMTFDVAPNRVYTLEGRCYSPTRGHPKAGVAVVTFFDASGAELAGPYPGLSHSERTGSFGYVAAARPEAPASFRLRAIAPNGAARVQVVVRRWLKDPIVLPEHPVWCEVGPAPDEQKRILLEEWRALVARCRQDMRKLLVVISSGTKPIGDSHRANRSMRFAIELADLGCATLYVYYRHDPLAALPPKIRPNLIQMPNDVFHSLAADLAACDVPNPRLFLCSIPDSHAVHEIGAFKHFGWSTIYEARDEWEEFHAAGVGRWYHHLFERYLCQHADRVVAVSPPLCDKMITFGARPATTHLVPNGTSQSFIDDARAQRVRRREQPYASERPVIGYFGHLTAAWFGWTLLLATAAARPHLSFEVIGYDAPADPNLPANVELLGPRSHEEIIALTENWALAIIPFKLGKLARAVDPIKVYEYLALGLKCVSCPMGQLDQYPLIFLYQSEDHFGASLEEALRYVPSALDWQRVADLLEGATWQRRVEQILDVTLPRPELAVREVLAIS